MNGASVRLQRELGKLVNSPLPGITCYPTNATCQKLRACVNGTLGSPYENGVFEIDIEIPSNYPFSPPRLRFITKIYHPNIDEVGRICLDILKVQPEGTWRPTYTIEGVLVAVQLLMTQPNPENPLMAAIANEYKFNKKEFERKAKELTRKFACSKETEQAVEDMEI